MQQRLSSVPSLHNSSHVSFSFLSYRLVDSFRRNKLIRLVITTLNVQRYLFHGYLFYFGLIFRLNYLSLLPQIFFLILFQNLTFFFLLHEKLKITMAHKNYFREIFAILIILLRISSLYSLHYRF